MTDRAASENDGTSRATGRFDSPYYLVPTIPGRYLVEMVAHTGIDAPRAFAAAGLPRDLATLTRFRANVEQFAALYRIARRACRDELFGFCTDKAPPGTYAAMLRFASGCRDVAELFESVARFYAIFDDGHRLFELSRDRDRSTLRFAPRTRVQERSIFFEQLVMLAALRTASWFVGEPIALRAVRLDVRFRRFALETAFLFGREPELVERGGCEVDFDAAWLRARPRVSPDDADRYARTSLRQLVDAPPRDTLEDQIRRVLADDEPLACSDLAAVAHRLHISRATLGRRLAARGLTFQQIKDGLRRDLAIGLLVGNRYTIAEIADRLGFSEPSAFTRAFKAWTNVAPRQYRARQSHSRASEDRRRRPRTANGR
jgi:AraC-like DNA-binding protein